MAAADMNSMISSIANAAGTPVDTDAEDTSSATPAVGAAPAAGGLNAADAQTRGRSSALTGSALDAQKGLSNDFLAAQQEQYATQQAYNLASSKLAAQNEMANGFFKQIRDAGKNGKEAMSA
jgi:hypothetical protein